MLEQKIFFSMYYSGYPVFESFRFQEMKQYIPERCKVDGADFSFEIPASQFQLNKTAFVYYHIVEAENGVVETLTTKSDYVHFELFTPMNDSERQEFFDAVLRFYSVPFHHVVPDEIKDKKKYLNHLHTEFKNDERIGYRDIGSFYFLKSDPSTKYRIVCGDDCIFVQTGLFESDYKKANKKTFYDMQKSLLLKQPFADALQEIVDSQRLAALFM